MLNTNEMLIAIEQNVNSNRNRTAKINSISENLTKIKRILIFRVSNVPNRKIECACAHIFQKRTWGALTGAGVLNRAITVDELNFCVFLYTPKMGLMQFGG